MASQEAESIEVRLQRMEMALEEERARRKQAEKAKDQAEKKLRNTTFLEFLDAVHVNLSLTLTVQTDKTLATKGEPSNATGKFCPKLIRPWTDFPAKQDAIWRQLDGLSNTVKCARVFNMIPFFEAAGRMNLKKKIASEKDLEFYERYMVESQVSLAIEHFSTDPVIREKMCLNCGVDFENHPNTLRPDDPDVAERMRQLNFLTPVKNSMKRNEARLIASTDPESILKHTDQICVYNIAEGQRFACFIVEYKAPHKLTLAHFQAGLRPMNPMQEVVNCPTIPSDDQPREQTAYHSGRLVAAVVTQAFSYMVESGLQYGYICTGEAYVFLHIRPEEPTTVYYHLSIPNMDVGSRTGWLIDSEGSNRLHLTAVGQVLAFTLQTLQRRSLGPEWIIKTKAQLDIWMIDPQAVLEQIPETVRKEIRHSTFKSSARQQDLLSCNSPRFLRSHNSNAVNSSRCAPGESNENDGPKSDDDDDDDYDYGKQGEDEIDTPTRSSGGQRDSKKSAAPRKYYHTRSSGRNLSYCTQRCLRGLLKGGILDKNCPNHRLHRKHGRHHSITSNTFLSHMRQQLSENLEAGCYPLYIQGSRGALFKVRLISHGYTVAAKCTIHAYVSDLIHEETVYKQLEKIQGIHIPVCLGNINLDRVYTYNCGVQIIHMMFMAWGGQRIDCQPHYHDLQLVTNQAIDAIHAIHELGILHKDVMPRNLLWNEEVQRVMFIDFERSIITTPLPTLAAKRLLMPFSRKRKWVPEVKDTLTIDCKGQGQEEVLEKPKSQIFTEMNTENEVNEIKLKRYEAAFSFEEKCLRMGIDGLEVVK